MDALRRLIQPTVRRTARPVRPVTPRTVEPETSRLRGPNKRLAEALDQLIGGVPINWGQVEDDPELLTLARLQVAGQECRLQLVTEPSLTERDAILDALSPTLDRIKHAPAPRAEKVAPKSMAGFSEKVQVLTQVEDDVAIHTNIPVLVARVTAIVAVAGLAVWGVFSVIAWLGSPTFSWIELKNGDTLLNKIDRTGNWQSYPCKVQREADPITTEYYQPFTSKRDLGDALDFIIPNLPALITEPPTYTLALNQMALAPCEPNRVVDADPGAILKLNYTAQYTLGGLSVPLTATQAILPDNGPLPDQIATQITLYVAKDQPTPLDISVGSWREVRIIPENDKAPFHGVMWHGKPYYDRAGVRWSGDVSVLTVERGDMLYTLIGAPASDITEEILLAIVTNSTW
jgi:hypothetical protein